MKRRSNEEEIGLLLIKTQHNAITIKIAPIGTGGRIADGYTMADIQAQVSMYAVGTLSENLIYKEIYSMIKSTSVHGEEINSKLSRRGKTPYSWVHSAYLISIQREAGDNSSAAKRKP